MNMMEPFGSTVLTQGLIHAGYILTAIAFLLRDILWLRVLAILANLCVAYAAFRSGGATHWIVISWATAFVIINLGHSIWLIYERHVRRFTEEEQRLRDTAFPALDPVWVRRLLRCGTWTDLQSDHYLARQGERLRELILIASGEAAVKVGERTVSHLSAGKFVGEISFLGDDPASATVLSKEPMRCIVWRQDELQRIFERRPELRNTFHAAIGRDLAQKIASHNIKLEEA